MKDILHEIGPFIIVLIVVIAFIAAAKSSSSSGATKMGSMTTNIIDQAATVAPAQTH